MRSIRILVACAAVAAVSLAIACDDGDDEGRYQGDAASVTAQFFAQERDGLRLPEETLDITAIGVQRTVPLDAGDADARVCVEHAYAQREAGAERRVRVYVASLNDGAWSVEAVKDDGTCEGVA